MYRSFTPLNVPGKQNHLAHPCLEDATAPSNDIDSETLRLQWNVCFSQEILCIREKINSWSSQPNMSHNSTN